jgi:hypothetical protein
MVYLSMLLYITDIILDNNRGKILRYPLSLNSHVQEISHPRIAYKSEITMYSLGSYGTPFPSVKSVPPSRPEINLQAHNHQNSIEPCLVL